MLEYMYESPLNTYAPSEPCSWLTPPQIMSSIQPSIHLLENKVHLQGVHVRPLVTSMLQTSSVQCQYNSYYLTGMCMATPMMLAISSRYA